MVEDTMFSGESKNIEYKVSLPDKNEKYMKTIVAFANTLHMAHPNGRFCGAKRPKCEAERSHHL